MKIAFRLVRKNLVFAGIAGVVVALCAPCSLSAQAAAPSKPSLRPLPEPIRAKLRDGKEVTLDEPALAARFALRKRLPAGASELPTERYVAALDQMRSMPRTSIARGRSTRFATAAGPVGKVGVSTWEPLGPGNVGGRTRALLIDPRAPRTMFAAGVAGGVWKSVNAGTTWAPIGDLLPNLAVTSLVMDPTTSATLYAGTGEGFLNFDAVRGAGIFKTTNGGATWTRLAATNNPNFHYVNDLVISTRNRNRIYAATRTGVWRSVNGGTSWVRILNPQVPDGCGDLAIRTDKVNDVVFASCGNISQGTVWRNLRAENTATWTVALRETGMGRTSIALAPSRQDTIYALAMSLVPGDFELGLHAVFRSTDGGANWTAQARNTSPTKLNRLLLSNPVIANLVECEFFDGNAFFNQGWYDNVIAVDPKDPNRVFAGGIDLFRSDDGGKNWGVISYWWGEGPPADAPSYAHADQHALVFHPGYNGTRNQTLYVGNDGGLFVTTNARAKSGKGLDVCDPALARVRWRKLNNGYEVTQFYHGAVFPDGATYFGGTQDNGTVLGDDASGRNAWTKILAGDGGYVAVDASDPDVLFAENFGLSIQKSTDGGTTFDDVTADIDDGGFLFIAPFFMEKGNPQNLWSGGAFIWRTDDSAESWVQASGVVAGPDDSLVSALAVAPSNPDRALVGLSGGYVHRNDHAQTVVDEDWPVVQIRDGYVSSVAFDPNDDLVAYATFSTFGGSHVWKSTDGGETWNAIDGSGGTRIPDIPVHVIVPDPVDPSVLYVGTDLGVFVSQDGGAHWAVENTGFAAAVTEHLEFTEDGSGTPSLFAFTHGRGAWKVEVTP